MSDAVVSAELQVEFGQPLPHAPETSAHLTVIQGGAYDEQRYSIYQTGQVPSDLEVADCITDNLAELKKRNQREEVICEAGFRSAIVDIDSDVHALHDAIALGSFALSDIVHIEVVDKTALNIDGKEHEISQPDERFVWNMMIKNRGKPLLARDVTTNPMFGSLQADLDERKAEFARTLDAMNERADKPFVLGHGNNKGRRYGLEPYVLVDQSDLRLTVDMAEQRIADLSSARVAKAARYIVERYPLDTSFARTYMYVCGVSREKFSPRTPIELKDAKKALSDIAGKGLVKADKGVRERFMLYTSAINDAAAKDSAHGVKRVTKAHHLQEFAAQLNQAYSQREDWVQKAECINSDPDIFHPNGSLGRKGNEELVGKVEAIIGTWCACCKVREECLDYAQSIATGRGSSNSTVGIRIMGGKTFGLSAKQKKYFTELGSGDLIGD